ncbi:helix-turn-helix domain-containing protein [Ruminococcaceae bacterium OttesenSCG-928-L11]|nr:helix-turn-helix domain-containing protein [Ruminococcaceae bacterium OttesenSCG-928-L11]
MSDVKKSLGTTMKNARNALNMTQDQLAERLKVTKRYIMHLESSRKKPSYDLLFKIIRELNIQPDLIFYPEKPSKDSRIEDLIRMLYNCDERSIQIVRATVKAALDSQTKE